MWLSASSRRSARCGEPCSRKRLSSAQVGYSAEHKQARDGESAAGVGVGAAGLERLVAQPAAQEAGHEGVAGAEHVVDLDRKARPLDAFLERIGDGAGEDDAAHRAALEHERRLA